jgi:hypothetical protein
MAWSQVCSKTNFPLPLAVARGTIREPARDNPRTYAAPPVIGRQRLAEVLRLAITHELRQRDGEHETASIEKVLHEGLDAEDR